MLHSFILLLFPFLVLAKKDPELDLTIPEVIQFYNYPFEAHKVTTKDGYILELHRIPHGRDIRPVPFLSAGAQSRPVVVMMHGIFADSFNFVPNPPASSAGFVFADSGFDVWMINCRGTLPSRRHVHLSSSDREFWNFTWYDHAMRDLTDSVDYILEATGEESVYYLAHSQGTIVGFARLAEDPDKSFAKKIRQVFALGPVGGFRHIANFLFDLPAIDTIYDLEQLVFNESGSVPLNLPPQLQKLFSHICKIPIVGSLICQILTSIPPLPETNGQFNKSREEFYLRHFPGSTSLPNILHWSQVIHYRGMRRFDYGKERNKRVYGQSEAPKIDVSTITTPTFLYYSKDDYVVSAADAEEFLVKHFGPALKEYHCLDHFTHLDFAIGLRAVDEVYKPIIRTIYEDLKERTRKAGIRTKRLE